MRKETTGTRPQAAPAVCDAPQCRRILRNYPFGTAVSCYEDWNGNASALSRLVREELPRDLRFRDLCFMDTETTGLSTGTGTVAFLIGLGYCTDNGFTVEQFFLEDLHQEEDALKLYAQKLASFRGIVTYNGKNYDLPLLETRSLMNRMRIRQPECSVDLLYAARRFYRGRYASCSLETLEREVLDVERPDGEDIPGSQIPSAYFRYLDNRQEDEIERIIAHNRQDLVSLAELTLQMCRIQEDPEAYAPDLMYACAVNELEAGDSERGETFLKKAAADSSQAAETLIWLYKRQNRWEEAYSLCRYWTDRGRGSLELRELQAKLEEHQFRNYEAALESCRAAIRLIPKNAAPEIRENWRHRRQRLLRKAGLKETI